MGYCQRFYDPIPLPGGGQLRTIRDAALYVLALSKEEQALMRWQTAAEALTLVGVHGGDPLLPRIAMMQALYPETDEPRPKRQKRPKQYRIIR